MTTHSPTLAAHLWPSASSRVVRNIALVVLGCALLWVSAKIKVPFWPVPMTLQTFAVMALSAAYGARLAPKRAVLTNMHIDLDYDTLTAELPPHVTPAFDGLVVDIAAADRREAGDFARDAKTQR